jgi:glucosylceramidase
MYVTHADRRLENTPGPFWRPSDGTTRNSILVNPESAFQEILGFGAAFTDAACHLLDQLTPLTKKTFLREVFGPASIKLSCCRICIGASDYATKAYSYDDDGPDPELEHFTIDHDKAYIMPIIKEARELCPDLFLLASPWSPPGWMKVNGSMLGGLMQAKHFVTYSNYFVKFLQSYAEMGIQVEAVSVQNEVDTDQEGLMPACFWGQASERRFVAEHLGNL